MQFLIFIAAAVVREVKVSELHLRRLGATLLASCRPPLTRQIRAALCVLLTLASECILLAAHDSEQAVAAADSNELLLGKTPATITPAARWRTATLLLTEPTRVVLR
jgi:hypothetical protein